MLYSSLSQPLVWTTLFCAGLICGLIYPATLFFIKKIKKNTIIRHLFDFIFVILCGFCYYFLNLYVNYGQFRFFSVVAFLLGFGLAWLATEKLFAKLVKTCYNKFHGKRKAKKGD